MRRDRSFDDDDTTSKVQPGRVARLHVDREDALIARLSGLQALTAAGRALSRWIAHVPLIRRLAASKVVETHPVGLTWLVFLGDLEHATTLMKRRLRDPRALDHLREGWRW